MSKIPKCGAVPLLYVVEESRGHAWRPLGPGSPSQREALAELDQTVTSYTRRVVQVVAVRLPPDSSAADRLHAYASILPACAMATCEAPAAPGSLWCAAHLPGRPENARREGEYGPDRYASEDFPRPRGVAS